MRTAAEFYAERDRRSLEAGATSKALGRPVGIVLEVDTARTVAGQKAALATVNMLARVHRRVELSCPNVELRDPTPFSQESKLRDAMVDVMGRINPFLEIGSDVNNADAVLCLGSTTSGAGKAWCVGADGATAWLDRSPSEVTERGATALGAALAACLGTAALFKEVHGLPTMQTQVSLWPLAEVAHPTGPEELRQLDVGNVAVIGAGAVGSALAYWTRALTGRPAGEWCVVDHDRVALHNTNRGLAMLPEHAGWPEGESLFKAPLAADLLGGAAVCERYEEWLAGSHRRYDLILPLANGPGVRAAINNYPTPILLHATTTPRWMALVHRHIAGHDQCIECRLPDDRVPVFECGTGKLESASGGTSSDAALPFVSAAAGLMLLASMFRLQTGELARDLDNLGSLRFQSVRGAVQTSRAPRSDGCQHGIPTSVLREVVTGRWAGLLRP